MRAVAPCCTVCGLNDLSVVVKLSVEHIEGSISVDSIAGLLAVAILEGRVSILSNLVPGSNVAGGIKVLLELDLGAATS